MIGTNQVKPFSGKIIAIDFDGTCVTHEYPRVGRDIGAIPTLLELTQYGAMLILWTMRSGKELHDAADWFEKKNIPLFGVNLNPGQISWTASPKAYAHIYIDDAALGAPLIHGEHERPYLDWKLARQMLGLQG
jgi:hypothetical protein